jgi:exopolyphosphatase/guanosine-5'-triphosphate,3'-diphosphate pyrophosphatase
VTVQLAEGMAESDLIGENALARAHNALQLFQSYIEKYKVEKIRVCATQAVRQARNKDKLQSDCQHVLGTAMEVLSGTEEASLTQTGVSYGLPSEDQNSLIIDVGGGSTECIFSGTHHFLPQSFPIGALTITEHYFDEKPASLEQIKKASGYIKKILTTAIAPRATLASQVIGSGGTATSLAALTLGLQRYDAKRVHGSHISQPALASLFERLSQLSTREKSLLPGMDAGRGKIILGGALIYCHMLQLFPSASLYVSDYGLLEGIFLSLAPD